MQRRWILLGICVLLLGGAFWRVTHIDWESYRPELAVQISNAFGADVRLNGPLAITLFPYPKLSAADAELIASGVHISAPHLRLAAKLWPLLRGRIILSSAEIENPKMVMVPGLWQAPRSSADYTSHTRVRLEDVEIENGELDIDLGQDHEVLKEINLQLGAPDWHGPYQADGDFMWQGQPWDITAQVGVKTPAGTRPASITLVQSDGPHQISWQGSVRPVPITLLGDGEWQLENQKFSLKGEVNFSNQVLEVLHGQLHKGDEAAGTLTGHFSLPTREWQDLEFAAKDFSPGVLPNIGLGSSFSWWQHLASAGNLQLHLRAGGLGSLKFESQVASASMTDAHWHVWGRNGATALAALGYSGRAPAELASPFDAKFSLNKKGGQMETLRIGKLQGHGDWSDNRAIVEMNALMWPTNSPAAHWPDVMKFFDLRALMIRSSKWALQPFSAGEGVLSFQDKNDKLHMMWETPGFTAEGNVDDNAFTGQWHCGQNESFQRLRLICQNAKVTMDGQAWHLDAAKGETVLWHGALDFGARTWTLKIPATHGEMDADGKLNQPDWHLEFEDLSLKDVLAWLLPAAPQGDGEISGQIHVGTEKADGNFTANNLQTPGLNLWLNNPDQSGRIGSATGKINWQGDVLELEQIHTAGPVGTGHASVNLDSAIWHGRWEDGRSSVVDVDGPAASASAQKRKATE